MANERREVSVFRNGTNQAVRIPREFELPSTRAVIYRDGDRLILEPASTGTDDLLTWLQGLPPEDRQLEDVPDETRPPPLDAPDL